MCSAVSWRHFFFACQGEKKPPHIGRVPQVVPFEQLEKLLALGEPRLLERFYKYLSRDLAQKLTSAETRPHMHLQGLSKHLRKRVSRAK